VAEGDGLLNRYTAKNRIGGSNPPLSASLILLSLFGFEGLVATNPPLFRVIYGCQPSGISPFFPSFNEWKNCSFLAA
jgi:hypothetical protein